MPYLTGVNHTLGEAVKDLFSAEGAKRRLHLKLGARVLSLYVERADTAAMFLDELVPFEEPQKPQLLERILRLEGFGFGDHLDVHVSSFIY